MTEKKSLLQIIKDDALTARTAAQRSRDEAVKASEGARASLLILLSSDAANKGKNNGNRESTDEEVAATVKSFIDNATTTLKALGDSAPEQRARIEGEIAILQVYMPAQADPAVVIEAINTFVAGLAEKSPKQMGAVMGHLTARFGANFDKKAASELVKAALK